MKRLRVFLADWQILFREGIHFILSGEEDFEVIGETTGNEETLDLIEKNPPTLAILNANGNKPSGIEITRRIKQNLPSVAVILIVDDDNEERIFSAIKSGANACLSKDVNPEELIETSRKASAEDYPISRMLLKPIIASRTLNDFEVFASIGGEVDDLMSRLSPGETEFLNHIADGSSPEEVAKTLNLDEESVSSNLNLIRKKLVNNDRNREVIEATQSNLPLGSPRIGVPPADYVTREEFNAFKDSLTARFKSLIGESG